MPRHAIMRLGESLTSSLFFMKSRSRYYKPEKTGWLVFLVFGTLFAGATFLTLTSVHNQQQITHCEQGWLPACEGLK